jgi:hypothetical protein
MPSTAEYVLGALLLAAELGGDGDVVKLWVRDCQENSTTARAEWRDHLAQAYKLKCGDLLSRVKYLFQRWAHMEVTDMSIETYCSKMSKSRRVKVVNKMKKNRMLAGHDGHFEKLCEHVLQIEPTHLEYLAGKAKRFGTGKKCTAGEEPPPPTEELRDLKQQLTNSTKAIVRMGNTIAEKKQIAKDFRGELKSAQLRSAAAAREKDQQIDDLHGKLQGLQFEMKKLQVANAEMHERVRKLNNDVIEAHTANIGIVDGADTLLERVSDSMSVAPRAVMPAHLARMAMELAVNGVPAKRMAAVTCSVLKAAHPELQHEAQARQFGPGKTSGLKARVAVAVLCLIANCWRLAASKFLKQAASDDTEAKQRAVTAFLCWGDGADGISAPIAVPPVAACGGTASDGVQTITVFVFQRGQRWLCLFFVFCCELSLVFKDESEVRMLFPPDFEKAVTPSKIRSYMGDNCNTQLKIGKLMEELAKQAWITEGKDITCFVFFLLHCFQHIKNVWAKAGAAAEEAYLKSVIQPLIDAIPDPGRVTCALKNLYITYWKALGPRGDYALGYGAKQWPSYCTREHPKMLILAPIRPLGQRFDGEIECALVLYCNLEAIIGFCSELGVKLNQKAEKKTMLDTLLMLLSSEWVIAAIRARCILFLVLFWPMRFIVAGDSGVSNADMNVYVTCVESALEQLAQDGSYFVDADLDIFAGAENATVADFHARRRLQTKVSPDKSVTHNVMQVLEADVFSPRPDDKRAQGTDDKVVVLLQEWGGAMLKSVEASQASKWRDDGEYGKGAAAQATLKRMREAIDTDGTLAPVVNDACEALLGLVKQMQSESPDLSLENAAGMAAAVKSNVFGSGGWLDKADPRIAAAAVEFAWKSVGLEKKERAERREQIAERHKADHAAALQAAFDRQVAAQAKAEFYFELERLTAQQLRNKFEELTSNKQKQMQLVRDQMLIYHYYGIGGAKVVLARHTNDELLEHVITLAQKFTAGQRPGECPEQLVTRTVPCIGAPSALRTTADEKPLFDRGDIDEAVEVLRKKQMREAVLKETSGGDPYARLQPHEVPTVVEGSCVERFQKVQPSDGDAYKSWVPWTVLGRKPWGGSYRYVLSRDDGQATLMLKTDAFNTGAEGSWRLDMDRNITMINFKKKEMEKFRTSGLETKTGTGRNKPLQAGSIVLLKVMKDKGDASSSTVHLFAEFVTRISTVTVDEDYAKKHRCGKYYHTFDTLHEINGIKFAFTGATEHTLSDTEATIHMAKSKMWSESCGGSGCEMVPLEAIEATSEEGAKIVDFVLTKIIQALASEAL